MGRIVCKFGGTSLADAARLRTAGEIVQADPGRRIVVVSAPGRRSADDAKITDLLIARDISRAQKRLQQIADACDAPVRIDLPENADAETLTSRGEYYCARILAHVLGYAFIDATDLIRFCPDGTPDIRATYAAVRAALSNDICAVVPGFYGALPNGRVHTLPRGGSDTTGALIAAALAADRYENFTDVPGLMDCDPRLVPDAESVPFASCDEVKLLASFGAEVLHADAIDPVQRAGVPLCLRSTFAPEHPGTLIGTRGSDRPMIAVRQENALTHCAVAGPMPESFMPALLRRYPDLCPELTHCGATFSLPLPKKEAALLIRGLLKA